MTLSMKTFALAATTAVAAFTFSPGAASALDAAEKEELGAFIREYLIANPEILYEVQDALEAKQEAEQQNQMVEMISLNGEAIFNDPSDVALGNPEGDVTVVEFFDYNCGFCKRAMNDMDKIIASDSNVRFVLKEFPILGPDSIAAHRVSMAFRAIAPEKYDGFHRELLNGNGRATEMRALEVAAKYGVAEAQIRPLMDAPAVEESIRNAYDLAQGLGINGTPSYVIGNEAVYGALGADVLAEKIENMRSCQSTVC